MMNLIEKLKGHDGAQEKMQKIRDRERLLLTRLDRLLRSLMRKASPELSEHETKWFGELRRLKEEISGAGRYDEGSMTSRTALVRVSSMIELGATNIAVARKRICTNITRPQDNAGEGSRIQKEAFREQQGSSWV